MGLQDGLKHEPHHLSYKELGFIQKLSTKAVDNSVD